MSAENPLPINPETPSRAGEIMQATLGEEGMRQLTGQLEIWHQLNQTETLPSQLRDSLGDGDSTLPQGTLIHGVRFDIEALKGISQLGVVSGELIGIVEDAETHGCADFFKTPGDMSIAEYYAWAKEPVQIGAVKTKKGESNYLSGRVGIIVDPTVEGMAPILKKDAYQDSTMDFTRLPSGRTPDTTAAILGGVPRGAIAGLVFSDRIAQDVDRMAEVRQLFPTTPLLTQAGELLPPPAPVPTPAVA